MAPRTLRRVGVLATSGLLLATAAGTASATTRVATSLSIRAVPHASFATVSGVLLHGHTAVQDALVTLTAEPAGKHRFTAVQSQRSGTHGAVAFVVTPTATTRYVLLFAGNRSYRASHSGVVIVRAPRKAVASSLSIRTANSSINKGQSDIVSGVLRVGRTPLAGRQVTLLGRPVGSSAWTRQAAHETGPNGGVAFSVSPSVSRQFALAFAGDTVAKSAHSGVVTVLVRRPTSLSVRAASSSINPGASTRISGVLLAGRSPVAGHTVRLLSRVPGSTFAELATARTGSHGAVDFTVTPAQTTEYVLVSVRSARFTAARSGIVTVVVRKATTLSIAVAPGSSGGSTVSGVLQSGSDVLAGRSVALQSRQGAGGSWTTVATTATDQHGAVAFTVTPSATTAYQLVFATTARYLASTSSTVVVAAA